MVNKAIKINFCINIFSYVTLAIFTFFIDIASFSYMHKPFIQLLFCYYLVLLTKKRSSLLIFFTLVLLAAESIIFFGQVEYYLFFALLGYISTNLFKELIHVPIIVPLITLNLTLLVQKLFSIAYLHHPYNDFIYTVGHFSINTLLLLVYWIFENNGK